MSLICPVCHHQRCGSSPPATRQGCCKSRRWCDVRASALACTARRHRKKGLYRPKSGLNPSGVAVHRRPGASALSSLKYAPIFKQRNAASALGVRLNDPSERSCDRCFGCCSDECPMSKMRHDNDSGGYHTSPDCCSHGEAHVPLCQMQSN